MKKIIKSFLMFALIVATMGSVVSCKDHDEDRYNELRSAINKEISLRLDFESRLQKIETALANIKQCDGSCVDAIKAMIESGEIVTQDDLESLIAAKTQLEGLIETIENMQEEVGKIDDIQEQINQLNQTIIIINQTIEQILPTIEGKCDCEGLKATVEQLQNQIAGWSQELIDLNTKAAQLQALYDALAARVTANEQAIAILKQRIDNLNPGQPVDLSNYVTQAQLAAAQNAAAQAWAAADAALKEAMEKWVKDYIADIIKDYYNKTQTDAAIQTAISDALKDYLTETEIKALLNDLKESLNIPDLSGVYTKEQVDELLKDFVKASDIDLSKFLTSEDLADYVKTGDLADYVKTADLASYVTSAKLSETLADYVTAQQLEDKLANYYTKQDVDNLLKPINEAIDNINKDIEKIKSAFDNLLKSQITQVIIQGATNRIFGAVNIPATGGNTSLLATFWGHIDNNVNFPYTTASNYYYASQYNAFLNAPVVYADTKQTIEAGDFVATVNGSEQGNLGKIYMTINPTELDLNGKQPLQGFFTSADNQAPVVIDGFKPSTHEMQFGWNRAAGEVGFYEADVTLKAADINKARLQVDLKEVAGDMKALLKERNKTNLVELAASLYKNVQNVLPAYGARVQWTDANNQTHTLNSQYNLGITTVKPFAFNAIDGLSDKIAPNGYVRGYTRVQNFLGRIIDEAKSKVMEIIKSTFKDFDFEQIKKDLNIQFQSIEIGDIDALQTDGNGNYWLPVHVNTTVHFTADVTGTATVPAQSLTTEEQNIEGTNYTFTVNIPVQTATVSGEAEGDAPVNYDGTVDMNWLKEFINEINARYGEGSPIEKALASLTNLLNTLSSMESNLNSTLNSTFDEYEKRIQNYITRLNDKLVNYIDKAELMLQLTMVGATENHASILSESKRNPTKTTKSSLTLTPTSYSYETLAPAYKKWVAVTNVFKADDKSYDVNKDASLEAVARAANGTNMATVFDGRQNCKINGQKGYIYEISYAALDFHGKICVKKFFVEFK